MAKARQTRARACIGRAVPPPHIVLPKPVVPLLLARLRRPEGPSRTSRTFASPSPATLLTSVPRAEAAEEEASGVQPGAQAREARAASSVDRLILLPEPPAAEVTAEEKTEAGKPSAATAAQAAKNTGSGSEGSWDSHLIIAEAARWAIPVKSRGCRVSQQTCKQTMTG